MFKPYTREQHEAKVKALRSWTASQGIDPDSPCDDFELVPVVPDHDATTPDDDLLVTLDEAPVGGHGPSGWDFV